MLEGSKILTKQQFIAKKGNVIVSKIDASKGAISIVPDELDHAVVTSDFLLFEINTNKIDVEYLDFCLRYGDHFDILSNNSRGTTNRQRVKVKDILNLSIFVPTDKNEQREIVENLKNQESLKKSSEFLIAKMGETGIDNSYFETDSTKLIPFTHHVTINPNYDMSEIKDLYNVLDMDGVDPYDGAIGNFTLKDNIRSTCKFKNDDIIFAKMTTGKKLKVARIDCLDDGEIGFGSSEFLVLKPDKSKILPEWLFFFCKSNYVRKHVKQTIRGTTRNRIPPNFFETIKMPNITKNEQRSIVKDLKKYTNMKKPLEELNYVSDKTIHGVVKKLFD